MKILHLPCVHEIPARGGIEVLIKALSQRLLAGGHQVTIACSDMSSPDGFYSLGIRSVILKRQVDDGVMIVRLIFGGWLYRLASCFAGLINSKRIQQKLTHYTLRTCLYFFSKKVIRFIKLYNPDVVLAIPHLLPNITIAIEAKKRIGFPLVIAPCLHEEEKGWPVQEMALALKHADCVIALTAHEEKRLIEHYGVDRKRVVCAGYGIEIPDRRPDTNASKKDILFLGRKVKGKGITLLIEAMKLVWQHYPDTKLILAGAKSHESQYIETLINALSQEQKRSIESLDDITEETKSTLLSQALCLVLPSKIESFGGVILEAWSHQTPAIAFDLPVFRCFVENGKDGVLVKPDDPQAISEAIIKLIKNKEWAIALGKAGKEKAVRQFSWDMVTSKFLFAYEQAMQNFIEAQG